MSLFQCESCGCVENTALCDYHWRKLNGRPLICSACGGEWHGEFDRIFLPAGEFETNAAGDLAHAHTGDTDWKKYALDAQRGGE